MSPQLHIPHVSRVNPNISRSAREGRVLRLFRQRDPHTVRREKCGDFRVKRPEGGAQFYVAGAAPPFIKVGGGVEGGELGLGKPCGMAMKRESRESVQLLVVVKSALRAVWPPSGGEHVEERLALAELNPLFQRKSWGNRNLIGHNFLTVRWRAHENVPGPRK